MTKLISPLPSKENWSRLILFFTCAIFMLFPIIATAVTPFEAMDRNHDGRLSSSEFRGPERAFMRLDQNRDGYITEGEAFGTRLLKEQARPGKERSYNKEAKPGAAVDTHNHLVGRRKTGNVDLHKQARITLKEMDASGVRLNLILPMPQTNNQHSRLYFEDLLPIVQQYPDRFGALGGGGSLNVMIQEAIQKGSVTEEMKKAFDARAAELVRKGALGFGEMTAEHFSMDQNHPYITAPPDHSLFLRLADLAAQYGKPIDLHMEAIPNTMPLPRRFKSPPNPQTLKPNIEALNRLLAHNRKAKIIWVHLGWDNTGKRTVELTRRLLAENPNLYMSIRIASGMRKRGVSIPTFPLTPDGGLKEEWLALFLEFPDRFLIGGDEIVKFTDDHPSAGSIGSTASLLDKLPSGLKALIGHENARRLYHLN